MNSPRILQLLKYGVVGVLNTVVPFGVIYICKSLLGWNIYVCNVLGYIAGLVNSFMLNRNWTFASHGSYLPQIVKFGVGFAACYLLQLWVVWFITSSPLGQHDYLIFGIVMSGYGIATVVGNVVFTLANFVYSKMVTFKN